MTRDQINFYSKAPIFLFPLELSWLIDNLCELIGSLEAILETNFKLSYLK